MKKSIFCLLAVAGLMGYLQGTKHSQEAYTSSTSLVNRDEKEKRATVVEQAGFTTSGANKEARQRYLESLMNDHDKLSLSVKKGDAVATAKVARYLLCTLSGWEDWTRQHQKPTLLADAAPMKALLQQISSTPRPEMQERDFRKLNTLVEKLNKQLMQQATPASKK